MTHMPGAWRPNAETAWLPADILDADVATGTVLVMRDDGSLFAVDLANVRVFGNSAYWQSIIKLGAQANMWHLMDFYQWPNRG